MFDRLSDGFNNALRKLSGKGNISESNVREAMEEVRTALLEADVEYNVVEQFCEEVLREAIGREVTKSLQPGQEMIGIVHRKLVELLGGDPDAEGGLAPGDAGPDILRISPGPTIVMMCGLQGSGKTTTCGKLAGWLKKRGRSVMLCAADLQRPAAIEQLETVARQADTELPGSARVLFHGEPEKAKAYGQAVGVAVEVCQNALRRARAEGIDTLILDTAGRLHVNDELMDELNRVNRTLTPHQIFLVVDAMTGQDAVRSAKAFHDRLAIDGVVMTKFDSDTRGGAAISVKRVTGAPLRFVGIGEKLDALEAFHPERMAGRILGMGDVVSLVEKAQEQVNEEDAKKLEAKMAKGELTMDDFLKQMKTLRRMGPLRQIMGMLPGVGSALKDINIDEKHMDRVEAMIESMTPQERAKPDVINLSRRKRVASGSGVKIDEVGGLVKQFGVINKLTKTMAGMSGSQKAAAAREFSGAGGMAGMQGLPSLAGKGSTKAKARGVKKRKPKKR